MEQLEPQPPRTLGAAGSTVSVPSLAVQIAAYAGIAMGLVGTVALVATSTDPSPTTILLVAIAVTAVLFGAGIAISAHAAPSTQRLRSVLWFAALLGWAVVVEGALVVAEIDLEGRSRQLLSSVLIAVGGVALWVGLRRTLQLLGMFVSLLAVLSAAVFPEPGPFEQPEPVPATVLTWLFGAAWIVLGARGAIKPSRTALVLGTITVLSSPVILATQGIPSEFTLTVTELWVLAAAVACLILGSWFDDRAVQGLAIVGLLGSVSVLAGDLLAGTQGGSIASVVIGIALLGGAVLAIRVVRGPQEPEHPPSSASLPEPPNS